jgi:hypothetical protein
MSVGLVIVVTNTERNSWKEESFVLFTVSEVSVHNRREGEDMVKQSWSHYDDQEADRQTETEAERERETRASRLSPFPSSVPSGPPACGRAPPTFRAGLPHPFLTLSRNTPRHTQRCALLGASQSSQVDGSRLSITKDSFHLTKVKTYSLKDTGRTMERQFTEWANIFTRHVIYQRICILHTFSILFCFLLLKWDLTILPRLVLNSWAQAVLCLSLLVAGTTSIHLYAYI